MRALSLPLAALLLGAHAKSHSKPHHHNEPQPDRDSPESILGPDEDGKYWIYGDGISAAFVPYGASIANLLINDKNGVERDIVTGFDNATHYTLDTRHDHFGGVPGRYANRIKNSTFEIDGVEYNILPNDNPTDEYPDGVNTLHGGPNGWDWRNFTVVAHTNNSITFSIFDEDGEQGFPGDVVSYITYTLNGMNWDFSMVALPTTKKTPIMLTSHTYWNLDGFANDETNLALNHTVHAPYSTERIGVDSILIPTGEILDNEEGSVNDFWSEPKAVGASFEDPEMPGNCGEGCVGYDNCYTVTREEEDLLNWRESGYVLRLSSPWSGIQLDIYSDQEAVQLYSCNFQDGGMPLKKTQGFFDNPDFPRTIPKYGCVVIEVQEWIDGINHPEWGRDAKQFFEPGGQPYVL
ncbi:hypothetical protein jhhlp_004802 [Lomentospora prolificans]|uniref:Aldose 1-epimerase n=1 Tax=Lomentospora prolificans TaxID=41688 RepID=A0A2N3N8G9_9PEZI|nr:hypothetical protein jhhlp_004802 [Lomentospora prolificans]